MSWFNLRIDNAKTTVVYWLSFFVTIYALFNFELDWFAVAIAVHVFIVSLFSALMHRYYSHRSFEMNEQLAWALACIPIFYVYATPLGWCLIHNAHHAYADTEKDSHIKGWRGILTSHYRTPSTRFAVTAKWFFDKKHEWLHNYAFGLAILFALVMLSISVKLFVWAYMVPVFTLHLFNCLHSTFSHKLTGVGATRYWWMEFILPMGGEWMHDEHHEILKKAKLSNKWYEFDSGWLIIKLLQKTSNKNL